MKLNKTKVKEFWKKNKKAISICAGGCLCTGLGFYAGNKLTVHCIANDIATKDKFKDLKTCFMLREVSNYAVECVDQNVDIDKLKDVYDIALRNGFDKDSTINGVLIYGNKK